MEEEAAVEEARRKEEEEGRMAASLARGRALRESIYAYVSTVYKPERRAIPIR